MRADPHDLPTASRRKTDSFGAALLDLAKPLRRRAVRLTRNSVEADDLVQETLTRAWSARGSFELGTSLKAWTFTILRNLFLSNVRRSRRTVDLDEHVAEALVAVDADQHEQVELNAVLEAIDHLPPDQRLALRAVALDGLDYGAAAIALNVTPGALKSRVRRARRALARMVEDGVARPAGRRKRTAGCSGGRVAAATSYRGVWTAAKKTGQPLWIG